MPPTPLPASTNPTIAEHLRSYQVPPSAYTEYFKPDVNSTGDAHSRLVASAVVIHSDRVLLLQRAAHGFQPSLWELPGGRCESRDATVIASAVRELWEESGLLATHVVDVVGEYEWLDRGRPWKKITFLVTVDHDEENDKGRQPQVKIDPEEQDAFLWATLEDVMANRCGDVELSWTSVEQRQTVLNAFRVAEISAGSGHSRTELGKGVNNLS